MAGQLAGVALTLAAGIGPGLETGRRARVGLPESAKAPLAAAIAAAHPGPTLLLTSTPARAGALAEEIQSYAAGTAVLRLPEQERLPYEFARDEQALRIEQSRALTALRGHEPILVIASWAAMAEFRGGPASAGTGIEVRTGARLDPDEFAGALEANGYTVEPMADAPGVLTRRGGIIDVFPADGDRPYRIDLFGDEVDSIRLVDLATQRSVGRVDYARFGPAIAGTPVARDAARRLLKTIDLESAAAEEMAEQLNLVAEGYRSEYAGFFEQILHETTAFDHLAPDARVLADEPEDGFDALTRVVEHHEGARAEQERRGAIPHGLPALHLAPDGVKARLDDAPNVTRLSRFGAEEFGARRLPIQAVPAFAGRVKPLAQQVAAWTKAGRAVVVASQQALRLAELMEQEGLRPGISGAVATPPAPGTVALLQGAVGGGFVIEDGLILVTDEEIFGFRRRRKPVSRRTGVRAELLASLSPGDYVVHADHGIARFAGLMRRLVGDVEREYLELQYAEGDRIFVPTDQMDAVSRYVGPSEGPPHLTRLGSQEWVRAKARVKRAVAEIAQELVELYAKRELARGHAFKPDTAWQMEMEAAFPFIETSDQLQAIAEVKQDMERAQPMDRLICGDVGYGKTEVAIRAAFKAVNDGKQVGVLVPTTVLAEQHGDTFRERVAGFPVRVEVLSRFRSPQEQAAIVEGVRNGSVDIVVGTHRLLQKDVMFKDLGLVVIDEEQRFGVAHKERLKQMREEVDVLTLSATPIPRTLQMSLVGIRDMSTVMTPPEERLPVRTYVTEWDDEIVREAIDRELERGGQAFFVHNRVQNIERIVAQLREIVPDASFVVGHGQMPEEQLSRVMMEFAAGDHDVLVCTTIIESGLDIPNVNTIIINNANQFGLAQLYQLRGRVGRASNRAYAYLLFDRNRALSETAQKRLEVIFEAAELGSGFQIALRDMEIRGAGNVLGTEQSGQIAAVGLDLYSKLVAEAVEAIKRGLAPDSEQAPVMPPPPSLDLPISASIPEQYIGDLNHRLAMYQRIADIETAQGVAAMEAELRDRYGEIPPVVESLLYVSLVKSLARKANVSGISTSEQLFHLRIRNGATDEQRRRVNALGRPEVLAGPNQVRIDRVGAGEGWMQLVIRVLRALAVESPEAAVAGVR